MFNYKILIINLFLKNSSLSLGFDFFSNFLFSKSSFFSLGKNRFSTIEKKPVFFQFSHYYFLKFCGEKNSSRLLLCHFEILIL